MKKRVFRNKIVYWISIIYFLTISIALIINLIDITNFFNNKISYFFNLLVTIFTITIFVNLIEKFSKTTLLISIFLSVIILYNLFSVFDEISLTEIKSIIFHIIFLILVNFFKVNQKDILKSEEIDQIGNENFES